MYVLDCEDYSHCISWTCTSSNIDLKLGPTKVKNEKLFAEHSFILHDVDAFESEVMPVIFKEAKYDSFQRSLYRWGFIKSHRKKKRDSTNGKKSFTYHHTGDMFAKNDWEKCLIFSYSKTLKSAKNILMNEMSNTRVTFQPLDVDQKRVSLTYHTSFEKDTGTKRRLKRIPKVSPIVSSRLDAIQTRRIGNPNLLAIDDIHFEKSNVSIPSTFALPNLLTQSSSLYQTATIPMKYPRLDIDAMMMGPRLNPGKTSAQNMANSEYAKSILENAYRALANDTCFD